MITKIKVYSAVSELAKNTKPTIKEIKTISITNKNYIGWSIITKNKSTHTFILALKEKNKDIKHSISVNKKKIDWTGPLYHSKKNN